MENNFTRKHSRFDNAHPLKEDFRKRKVPLWCLRNLTGVPESKLSRYFNFIDPMPADLERTLYKLLFMLKGGTIEEWENNEKRLQELAVKAQHKLEEMLENDVSTIYKQYTRKSEGEANESNGTD